MNKSTFLLENRQLHPVVRLCHRYGSQLGVASCTFVRTPRLTPQYTSKVTCQQSWEDNRSQLPNPYQMNYKPTIKV